MTFAEFERLPDPLNGRYELRSGEVVLVPPAKLSHLFRQGHIRDLLRGHLPAGYHAEIEFAYRPSGDRDYRIADVAVFPLSRASGEYFEGAPDLVVEVLSPSNTAREMLEKERLCFDGGTLEFWTVDDTRKQVRVSTPEGLAKTFHSGESIPLFFAPGKLLSVDSIFA